MIVSRSTIDTFLGSLFLQQFVYISLCLLYIMKLNIGRASGGSQVLASVFSYCNICTSYPPILTPSRVCALSATIFVNRIEQIVNVFCHLTISFPLPQLSSISKYQMNALLKSKLLTLILVSHEARPCTFHCVSASRINSPMASDCKLYTYEK